MVIRAEGGAGKTVLAAQWMHAQGDEDIAWVAIDESVADAKGFWFRVFASLMATSPKRFRDLADAYFTGLITTKEVAPLFASALQQDPTAFTFVFDDLHHVNEDVQDQLVSLVRRVPNLRIVATSRLPTRFETPEAVSALDTHVIGSSELAFDHGELELLAEDLPVHLDQTELAAIERVARGHTLASRLSLFLMHTLSAEGERRPGIDEVVRGLESIAGDFLPSFPDEREQRFAIAVAYAPEVDLALAERLTDSDRAWAMLNDFEQQGLGRMAKRRGRWVFLMHVLVASALRNLGDEILPPERIADIRAVTYEQLRDLADPVDTLSLLIAGGMDDAIWPHFVRHFSELSLHRIQELVGALQTVPEQRLARNGGIAILLAIALSGNSVVPTARARALAQMGLAALDDRGSDPLDASLISLARFGAQRVLRDYAAAASAGDTVLQRLQELGNADGDIDWNAGKLQIVFSNLLDYRLSRFDTLANILADDPHPGRQVQLHALRGFAAAHAGDMASARTHIDAVGIDERSGWRGSHPTVGWLLANALQLANTGDADGALELIAPLTTQLQLLDLWPAVLWTRGIVHLTSGRVHEGIAELIHDVDGCRGHPISDGWAEQLLTLRVELQTASGDFPRALATLSQSGTDPATRLAGARLQLLLSQPEKALAELDAPVSDGYRAGRAAQRTLLRAIAHEALDNTDVATALAEQGFAALQRLDDRLTLSFLPADSCRRMSRLAGVETNEPIATPFQSRNAFSRPLTRRETVILTELATGGSIGELAQRLHVSPNTVKSQTRSLYRKLGASGRAEAISTAARMGLL